MTVSGMNRLAAEIVECAFKDYKNAWGSMLKTHDWKLEKRKTDKVLDLERFFFGDWYHTLCNLDPNILINEARKRAEEEYYKTRTTKNNVKSIV